MDEGIVKLKINAPPVDGKANKACIKFLAEFFDLSKSRVIIISGHKSKTKLVEVVGDPDNLTSILREKLLDT